MCTAVDECWDIDASPMNESGNNRKIKADDNVVHSDCISEL